MCVHLECFHMKDGGSWIAAWVWTNASGVSYATKQHIQGSNQSLSTLCKCLCSDKPHNVAGRCVKVCLSGMEGEGFGKWRPVYCSTKESSRALKAQQDEADQFIFKVKSIL